MMDESKYTYIGHYFNDNDVSLPTLEYINSTWVEISWDKDEGKMVETPVGIDDETDLYLRMKYL